MAACRRHVPLARSLRRRKLTEENVAFSVGFRVRKCPEIRNHAENMLFRATCGRVAPSRYFLRRRLLASVDVIAVADRELRERFSAAPAGCRGDLEEVASRKTDTVAKPPKCLPGSFTVVAALIRKPATTARRTRPQSFDFLNRFIKATAVKSARFLARTTVSEYPHPTCSSSADSQPTYPYPFSAPVSVTSLRLGKNDISTFQSSAEPSCASADYGFDS